MSKPTQPHFRKCFGVNLVQIYVFYGRKLRTKLKKRINPHQTLTKQGYAQNSQFFKGTA